MFSKAIIKYALLAAIRDRLLWILLILMGGAMTLSLFSASAAVTEQQQFTLVFMGSSLRLLGVFGFIIFVCFQLRRLYDHKEIDYLLTAPLSRTGFLLSLSLTYMGLAFCFGSLVFGCLSLINGDFTMGSVLWITSVISEWLIVVAMAFFFSTLIKSATVSVLSTLSFYILSRLIGVFTGIASSGMGEVTWISQSAAKILSFISIIVPRFDLMGQSAWLIYSENFEISFGFIFIQLVVFTALFLSAAAFDLQRNEF